MILVIDDNQDARRQIVMAARYMAEKLPVLTAANSQEAIQQLHRYGDQLQLVVLDMRMTGEKGILLIPDIHTMAPRAKVLPYTIDLDAAEQMEALGALERIPKILPARDMASILDTALATPAPPIAQRAFYRYIAADRDAMVRHDDRSELHVVYFARDIESLGVRSMLERVGDHVRLTIERGGSQTETILPPTVVLGTLAMVDNLVQLHRRTGVRATIYADYDADVTHITDDLHVIFASNPARVADLLARNRSDELRGLSHRHRQLLRFVGAGSTPSDIARHLGISTSRMYHLLSDIYNTPGLPNNLDTLRTWSAQLT